MICPYCGKEMEDGLIQSPYEIAWLPGKKRHYVLDNAEFHAGSVVLSERSFWRGSAVRAYLCRTCGKVVIDMEDEHGDMNT